MPITLEAGCIALDLARSGDAPMSVELREDGNAELREADAFTELRQTP